MRGVVGSFSTTTNALTTFNFNSNEIRVVTIDDQPWFVAADVCRVLELGWDKTNNLYAPSRVVRNLDADEKDSKQIASFGQRLLTITESGLYKLVMRSDKPEAKEFQNWIARVVLPAIRKDGAYIMGEEKVASGEMDEDEFVLKAMTILQGKVERLKLENAKQAQVITEMKPAATIGAAVGTKQMSVYAFARNLHGVSHKPS